MRTCEQIVDFLIHNRVTTTEVADALGKKGVVEGVQPVNRGHYTAGIIKWIYAYDESNWSIHEQIQNVSEGYVIFVDAFDCGNRAIFGELVSKYLLLYRQSKAIVVNGYMRDTAELYRENYPIWCKGYNPVGCFNRKPVEAIVNEMVDRRRDELDGSIAVCDDCGVVIIPKNEINADMLQKLQHIEDQEDIWFDRLNHYKESTFEIVCEKKYLNDEIYMSHHIRN